MPKVTMDVPEGFEDVVQHLEKALQRAQKGVDGAQAGDREVGVRNGPTVDAVSLRAGVVEDGGGCRRQRRPWRT